VHVHNASLYDSAEDFEIDVVITTGGDVLFRVTLQAAIPVAVRLRVHFVSEDNPRNIQRVLATTECSAQLPLEHIQLFCI